MSQNVKWMRYLCTVVNRFCLCNVIIYNLLVDSSANKQRIIKYATLLSINLAQPNSQCIHFNREIPLSQLRFSCELANKKLKSVTMNEIVEGIALNWNVYNIANGYGYHLSCAIRSTIMCLESFDSCILRHCSYIHNEQWFNGSMQETVCVHRSQHFPLRCVLGWLNILWRFTAMGSN